MAQIRNKFAEPLIIFHGVPRLTRVDAGEVVEVADSALDAYTSQPERWEAVGDNASKAAKGDATKEATK